MNLNGGLLYWALTHLVAPACLLVAVLTIADGVLAWWRGDE